MSLMSQTLKIKKEYILISEILKEEIQQRISRLYRLSNYRINDDIIMIIDDTISKTI